jgi:putative transposase
LSLRHRNSLSDCNLFFVTTTVVNFLKIFSDETACDILISNIKHYQSKYKFKILSYVIMPTHFHWIVETDNQSGTMSDVMRDLKKYSAWDLLKYFEEKGNKMFDAFQEGAEKYKDQKRKFWMPRFDDEAIRNDKMFWAKLKYIHDNPLKAGLVQTPEQYKYSSARNYVLGDHSIIMVDVDYAGIQFV